MSFVKVFNPEVEKYAVISFTLITGRDTRSSQQKRRHQDRTGILKIMLGNQSKRILILTILIRIKTFTESF